MGERKMVSQKILLVLALLGGAGFISLAIWSIYFGIKYKANHEEAKEIVTKARASAHYYMLYVCIFVWGMTVMIDQNILFTVSNLSIFILFILGMQCAVELIASMYYVGLKKNATSKVIG